MTVSAPETTDLEQLWDETPPACEITKGCQRPVAWVLVISCSCRSGRRYMVCDPCRKRWEHEVRFNGMWVRCKSCLGEGSYKFLPV